MSDLAAAAAAMNVPETLVQRSAEARATATGASVDEILAAWAGGGSAPAATSPATSAPEPEPAAAPEPAPEHEPAPEPETQQPAAAQPATVAVLPPAPAAPAAPPILDAERDRPFLVAIGAVAALALSLLAGVTVASTPEAGNGVYTSAVPLTRQAADGREVYLELGCPACHTQMVRPLVTDAGLGGVTVSDSNQVLGARRFGPDLAHVADRVESADGFTAILGGEGGHPAYTGLDQADVDGLIAYLRATNTVATDEDETGS